MPANTQLGKKVPTSHNKNKASGVDRGPGPYIAVVKNNVDPTRAGRLQVFIPDFGGSETEESNWVTVGYASPYMGSTRWPRIRGEKPTDNKYDKVNHAYGMWMTPPDVGNSVLVMFIAGDQNKGYWFACIVPELTQYAMPGGAGAVPDTRETTVDPGLISVLPTPPYPVTEFNDANTGLFPQWTEFLTIPKPIHEGRVLRLLREGLEDDKIRGVITTSGQRESPSRVFGISTPGPGVEPHSPDHDLAATIGLMPDLNDVKGPQYRLGGHTFIMDDGDQEGKDRMIRLRTSSGHQIMMNDTHGFLYVANAEGTAWFEMTKEGKFYFYGKDSISFRTEKDFNVHADKDINMYAGAGLNSYAVSHVIQETPGLMTLRADTELNMFGGMVGLKSGSKLLFQSDTFTSHKIGTELVVQAGGNIGFKAGGQYIETAVHIHMNGPVAPDAKAFVKPAPIDRVFHYDPKPVTKYPKWKPMEIKFVSSCPIVPTHEPYNFPDQAPARPDCCKGTGGSVEEGHVRPHDQPPKGGAPLHDEGPIQRLPGVNL